MDDATRSELLNAEIDGVTTETQRSALAELLQRDPSAREELEALRALAELLGRVPAPGAPDSFADGVMTAVHRVRETSWMGRLKGALIRAGWSWGPQREDSINLSHGHGYVSAGVGAPKRSREDVMARQQNMFQRRMIFAGAGVLAVAALVVYFGGYYPPAKEEAYGTIGAAERYRSTQITPEDVKLDSPEVQAFLQSETFDRIVRDPEARQALSNSDLQAAIVNDKFADAMVQSIRLGADANIIKMRAEANQLAQDAAGLAGKVRDGVSPDFLKDAVLKLQSQAIGLEGKVRDGVSPSFLKDSMKLSQDAAGLAGKVRDGVSPDFLKDAFIKFNKDATALQMKFAEAQISRLNDAANQLRADAASLQVKGGAEANRLSGEMMKLAGEATGLAGKVRDGVSPDFLKDAYIKFSKDALSLQMKGGFEANSLRFAQDAASQMAREAPMHDAVIKFNSQATGLSGKVRDGVSPDFLKDASVQLGKSATELARVTRGFEANTLQDAIMKFSTGAATLQKQISTGADANILRGSANTLSADAIALQKKVNLFGDANKLAALGLDAKGLSAISKLARDQALYQAINQHEAALSIKREQ
jgi:hypothetical protein